MTGALLFGIMLMNFFLPLPNFIYSLVASICFCSHPLVIFLCFAEYIESKTIQVVGSSDFCDTISRTPRSVSSHAFCQSIGNQSGDVKTVANPNPTTVSISLSVT